MTKNKVDRSVGINWDGVQLVRIDFTERVAYWSVCHLKLAYFCDTSNEDIKVVGAFLYNYGIRIVIGSGSIAADSEAVGLSPWFFVSVSDWDVGWTASGLLQLISIDIFFFDKVYFAGT